MMRLLAVALALFALALPVGAQEADPVNITADNFVVDDAARVATFTGGVVVKRKKLTVWAPKVVVEYGENGPSSVKSFVASGGVRIKTDGNIAVNMGVGQGGGSLIYNAVILKPTRVRRPPHGARRQARPPSLRFVSC